VITVDRGEVTSSRDVSMTAIQQRRPLTTGSDVTADRDGGADAAEAEEEAEPSLCCKNDIQTVASTMPD